MNMEHNIFIQSRRNLNIFRRRTPMFGKVEGVASAHNREIFWNKLNIFVAQVYNRELCAVLDSREAADVRTFSVAHIHPP